jgi:2-polyprenyl-6-methoxyphenol hydroxylase-like FAD-dependent oxidoreductase
VTVGLRPQVLVVGAGPTGLLLAAELVRRGVSCLLIDALDTPLEWDRATVVHERSLQIFESLGVVERFLTEGVRTRGARFHADGGILAELSLDLTRSRYGVQIGISEEVTESVLTDYLEAHGGAVTRSTRLIGLAPSGDRVVASLERDGQGCEVVARWVVGCDRYRSAVRQATGIEFRGADIEAPWAVFDASLEGWEDDYDTVFAYLDQPSVIMTPLPEQRWRVYLRPLSGTSDLVAEAGEVLEQYAPGVSFAAVENPRRFRQFGRRLEYKSECRIGRLDRYLDRGSARHRRHDDTCGASRPLGRLP